MEELYQTYDNIYYDIQLHRHAGNDGGNIFLERIDAFIHHSFM